MNKSIAGFKIFLRQASCHRMLQMLRYYQYDMGLPKFSQFIERPTVLRSGFEQALLKTVDPRMKLIQIIAQTIMPTHFHVVVRQLQDGGISRWMSNIQNAYTRYYNTKYERRGPLWVGSFKSVRVKTDEQLLHLTRYVHLNARTAGLIEHTADWPWSSFFEYTAPDAVAYPLCDIDGLFGMTPKQHRDFINDQADYQRELAKIKKLTLE